MESLWTKTPPTAYGFYFVRPVNSEQKPVIFEINDLGIFWGSAFMGLPHEMEVEWYPVRIVAPPRD